MSNDQQKGKSDDFAKRLIRKKAKQLIGKAGFTQSDREDIEQDLYLKLIRQRESFDPEQAHWNVFVTTVVERHVANILRDKRAEKRDDRRICSLSLIIDYDDDGPIELSEMVGEREDDARRGRDRRSQRESTELRIDLQSFIDTLSEELRVLCEWLNRDTISQIAREQGVPRTTLGEQVRKLRQYFERSGLRDYL